MNSISVRIFLTVWPAFVFTALALPLPGVPFVVAFAVLVSAVVLLAKSDLDLRAGKATIGLLWLVSLACLIYFFIAFGAGVDATDVGRPIPAWAKMDWIAAAVGVLALMSATIALWLPSKARTTMAA